VTVAINEDPPSFWEVAVGGGGNGGGRALLPAVNQFLAVVGADGTPHPRLLAELPSLERGTWRVAPDGSMETVWRIRPDVRWHDGTPLTADDLTFTTRVIRDKEMADLYMPDFDHIEGAEAVDSRTVKVTWKRPFIEADQLFGLVGVPLPRHLLEQPLADDKASFSALPYWSAGFVGTGPFKVKEWVPGSGRILMSANDDFILGRPKIDEIEVRMITDNSLMVANILAGEVHVTMGRNLSFEQAQSVREQWRDGTIRIGATSNPMIIYPSFLYTDPPVVRDLRFRRAEFARECGRSHEELGRCGVEEKE
jgi:ABC-type transport system substrate-binding protein